MSMTRNLQLAMFVVFLVALYKAVQRRKMLVQRAQKVLDKMPGKEAAEGMEHEVSNTHANDTVSLYARVRS